MITRRRHECLHATQHEIGHLEKCEQLRAIININNVLHIARTTESIFHQNIIIMLAPGDKGLFEEYRNAISSDFDANMRKISKFEKNFFSKSTCHF